MIVLLSPAKSLDYETPVAAPRTQLRLKKDTLELSQVMKSKSPKDLKALMSISDKLADLNAARYEAFSSSYTAKNSKQAMYAFTGDVYVGLDAQSFTPKQVEFAQVHIRILSGLYGLVRPLDVIQPYRLEMGTKLRTDRGKNLYDFWGDTITKSINKDLRASGGTAIVNLASKEYFQSVNTRLLEGELYDIHFREWRGDQLKFISFSAKKARGYLAQYIVKKRIKQVDKIKGFDMEGYAFDPALSEDRTWFFTR